MIHGTRVRQKPGTATKQQSTNAGTQKGEEKPARQAARQAEGHGQAREGRRREKAEHGTWRVIP